MGEALRPDEPGPDDFALFDVPMPVRVGFGAEPLDPNDPNNWECFPTFDPVARTRLVRATVEYTRAELANYYQCPYTLCWDDKNDASTPVLPGTLRHVAIRSDIAPNTALQCFSVYHDVVNDVLDGTAYQWRQRALCIRALSHSVGGHDPRRSAWNRCIEYLAQFAANCICSMVRAQPWRTVSIENICVAVKSDLIVEFDMMYVTQ